jgi:hypothetical protein
LSKDEKELVVARCAKDGRAEAVTLENTSQKRTDLVARLASLDAEIETVRDVPAALADLEAERSSLTTSIDQVSTAEQSQRAQFNVDLAPVRTAVMGDERQRMQWLSSLGQLKGVGPATDLQRAFVEMTASRFQLVEAQAHLDTLLTSDKNNLPGEEDLVGKQLAAARASLAALDTRIGALTSGQEHVIDTVAVGPA